MESAGPFPTRQEFKWSVMACLPCLKKISSAMAACFPEATASVTLFMVLVRSPPNKSGGSEAVNEQWLRYRVSAFLCKGSCHGDEGSAPMATIIFWTRKWWVFWPSAVASVGRVVHRPCLYGVVCRRPETGNLPTVRFMLSGSTGRHRAIHRRIP